MQLSNLTQDHVAWRAIKMYVAWMNDLSQGAGPPYQIQDFNMSTIMGEIETNFGDVMVLYVTDGDDGSDAQLTVHHDEGRILHILQEFDSYYSTVFDITDDRVKDLT